MKSTSLGPLALGAALLIGGGVAVARRVEVVETEKATIVARDEAAVRSRFAALSERSAPSESEEVILAHHVAAQHLIELDAMDDEIAARALVLELDKDLARLDARLRVWESESLGH